MVENLGKWPSKRGPISKIRPSDGCGRNAILLAVNGGTISTNLDGIWGMSVDPVPIMVHARETGGGSNLQSTESRLFCVSNVSNPRKESGLG